jgi:hypothetical protein
MITFQIDFTRTDSLSSELLNKDYKILKLVVKDASRSTKMYFSVIPLQFL